MLIPIKRLIGHTIHSCAASQTTQTGPELISSQPLTLDPPTEASGWDGMQSLHVSPQIALSLAFALEQKVWDSPEATVGLLIGLFSIVVSQVSGGPRRKR